MEYFIPKYKNQYGHHKVNGWLKVRRFIRSLRNGRYVPPYVVDKIGRLMSGHHRCAANKLLELLGDSRRIPYLSYEDVKEDKDWFAKYG